MGKPKAVNFELITTGDGLPIYKLMTEIIDSDHEELTDARIALAWHKGYRADKDGHVVLGKCMKVGDLQKEFAAYDFIIILNRETWEHPDFTIEKKLALLDHELCHAAPALDKETEEQITDERGRLVWRIRKHDIEEFREVVERHGTYKSDLEAFAEALQASKQMELQPR